jgi:hypothetical protein
MESLAMSNGIYVVSILMLVLVLYCAKGIRDGLYRRMSRDMLELICWFSALTPLFLYAILALFFEQPTP